MMNDFLYSNYAIYQGFFAQGEFNLDKLQNIQVHFQNLDSASLVKIIIQNILGVSFLATMTHL